jgi:hypothetical protein
MVIRKVRGAPTGNEVPFTTRVVNARTGDGQRTLVIEWLAERGSAAPPKEVWPPSTRVFRDAFLAALDGGVMRPAFGNGPMVCAVDCEVVRTAFYRRYPAKGDTEEKRKESRRKQFNRAIDYAREKNLIGTEVEGKTTWVWQIKADTE